MIFRDYEIVSPSLEGVLSSETLEYEGIRRPVEILRAFDSPAADPKGSKPSYGEKVLERYFYDLYGVFMKRLSEFVLSADSSSMDTVRLQAMLQEMIKVKKLVADEKKP